MSPHEAWWDESNVAIKARQFDESGGGIKASWSGSSAPRLGFHARADDRVGMMLRLLRSRQRGRLDG